MIEVEEKCYAGPFEEITFENFIQSQIGLVSKAGNKMRQIFYLSYNFANGNKSLNVHTPKEKCTIHYRDVDAVVKMSLKLRKKLSVDRLRFTRQMQNPHSVHFCYPLGVING